MTDNNPIELRGIMSTDKGMRFCIYDSAKKTSQWVGMNESGPIVIKSADPANDTVSVVSQDGRQMTLALRSPKTGSRPLQTFPPANTFQPLASYQPVLNPTPQDEQRRLQAIADEVRRRRLLRERGQQPGGQPGNGSPP